MHLTNTLLLQQVKKIVETGVNVIVSGGKVSDLALHFANKYKIMVVRLNSKWDLRRLSKTVNGTVLPRLVGLIKFYVCRELCFCCGKPLYYVTNYV